MSQPNILGYMHRMIGRQVQRPRWLTREAHTYSEPAWPSSACTLCGLQTPLGCAWPRAHLCVSFAYVRFVPPEATRSILSLELAALGALLMLHARQRKCRGTTRSMRSQNGFCTPDPSTQQYGGVKKVPVSFACTGCVCVLIVPPSLSDGTCRVESALPSTRSSMGRQSQGFRQALYSFWRWGSFCRCLSRLQSTGGGCGMHCA